MKEENDYFLITRPCVYLKCINMCSHTVFISCVLMRLSGEKPMVKKWQKSKQRKLRTSFMSKYIGTQNSYLKVVL